MTNGGRRATDYDLDTEVALLVALNVGPRLTALEKFKERAYGGAVVVAILLGGDKVSDLFSAISKGLGT